MQFPDNHFTTDWQFLSDLANESDQLRVRFGIWSRMPRKDIEEHWYAIIKTPPTEWPKVKQLAASILGDQFIHSYHEMVWKTYPWREREGFEFDEVRLEVCQRHLWTTVKCARGWLADRYPGSRKALRNWNRPKHVKVKLADDAELTSWGRFLNTRNLKTEFRRAIEQLASQEQNLGEGIEGFGCTDDLDDDE